MFTFIANYYLKITTKMNMHLKMQKQDTTVSMMTSPFQMEDLLKDIKRKNNNKAAGIDDMFCEQIKNIGPGTIDNEQYIYVTQVLIAMEEVEGDGHP